MPNTDPDFHLKNERTVYIVYGLAWLGLIGIGILVFAFQLVP